MPVRRVIDAIICAHIRKLEWVDAFQAPDVVDVLLGIRAALMMRIYAANRAEIVARRSRVELVQPQHILASDDSDA